MIDSAFDDDNDEISLVDIANIDYSDIKELKLEGLPPMLGVFEGDRVEVSKEKNKDDESYIAVKLFFKVVDVKAVMSKDYTPEELIGRTHIERRAIKFTSEEDHKNSMGYLKGFLAELGLDTSGPLGGVENAAPGFLDRFPGHRAEAKITRSVDKKTGNTYSNLKPVKQKA